ncbi:MAG: DUF1501 domain-containing protein [Planctomycetota bacterium]|nr:DUF1501 domain-containing protein [Planctomycetota bacterium]
MQPKNIAIDRRGLLKVGALTVGASPLAFSPWARSLSAGVTDNQASADSVLVLWMAGGVTQFESFDPKMEAPQEVRGRLQDTQTSLPGVWFGDTMSEMSKIAHKISLIRSFSHDSNDHLLSQVYTLTGRKVDRNGLFSEPNIGSIVSHFNGPRNGLPGYICVPGITRPGPPPHNLFQSGWMGSQYLPYCIGGIPKQADFTVGEKLDDPPADYDEELTPKSLSLSNEVPLARLTRRAALREQFDQSLKQLDRDQQLVAVESKFNGALRMLSTNRIRDAFDIEDESRKVRETYGRTKLGGRCLMARRLIEAGARFVVLDYGYDSDYGNIWDNHNAASQNHPPIQDMIRRGYHLAGLDKAFAALINDMDQRGMLKRTLVVFLTEFGRTPKINANGGRDHWGAAGSIFVTGGGVKTGQVIGATDKSGASVTTRPYSPADIAATMYHSLGIDHHGMVNDYQGRPRRILEEGNPVPELY